MAVAATINGFRWEMPCDTDPGAGDECATSAAVNQTRTLGGKAGTIYQVAIRVRGVVEPMLYKGGTADATHFRIGGTPNNGTYNIYSITVSDPPQVYYLNDATAVGHNTFLIDHMKSIPIRGGATVKFIGDGQNKVEIANFHHLVVTGVPPAPTPYVGQLIQLDVQSVSLSAP